ncbi:DNA damage-inducible transcript 4-like protein [Denticeps clupeoides]|uniref:DNA damage-inducible transcript 4-like protein n=1 Tax=Denticeps clupeoides TaxID=299321 RepID=UPI0010A51F0B|nr:DNA damage-inducible transcript 4-like protein [Denticeps clupeoides]
MGLIPALEEDRSDRSSEADLIRRIEGCLSQAKTSCLGCQELLLPRRLAAQITADILSLSADEPCGVRGALVRLFLEATDALQELGTLAEVDRSVTPTFEVSVLLRPDVDSWPALWSLFRTGRVLRLRPEYRLVKRKLYSSTVPVVHERSRTRTRGSLPVSFPLVRDQAGNRGSV